MCLKLKKSSSHVACSTSYLIESLQARQDLNVCSRRYIIAIPSHYEIFVIYCFNGANEMAKKLCENCFRMTQMCIFVFSPLLFRSFPSLCSQCIANTLYGVRSVNLLPLDLHFIAARGVLSSPVKTFDVVCFSDCLDINDFICTTRESEKTFYSSHKYGFLFEYSGINKLLCLPSNCESVFSLEIWKITEKRFSFSGNRKGNP